MSGLARRRALLTVMLVGAVYLVAGVGFGALSGSAATKEIRVAWRLAAWLVSAAAFAAQVAYEHFRLSGPARTTAMRAAAAVALGAFALAAAANVHAIATPPTYPRSRLLLALVLWPLLTAVPAFVVALVAGAGLARLRPRT